MQVLCRKTTENAECHCCVCGQGFLIFWDSETQAERLEARYELQEMLRRHHRVRVGSAAHPDYGFIVPSWRGTFCPGLKDIEPIGDLELGSL